MPPTSANPAWLAIRDIGFSSTDDIECPRPRPNEVGTGAPLFGDGSINLHQFMVYVSAGCSVVTIISCIFLSWRHIHRYTAPQEQRQILRIINLPVMYTVFNFLALTFTLDYMYIEPIGQIYEAFTVAALFFLVLEYVAPDGTDRESYFNNMELRDKKGNPQPGGSLKWFQRTWSSVLQYPVMKTVIILIQIITQYFGDFCESSWSFQHAHLYLTIFDLLFVGGALGATITFARRVGKEIAPVHKPRAKIWSFLGILIFQLIQNLLFHLLNGKLFNPTATATYNDINFGIASFMTCIEAVIFSFIFHWSFSSSEYKEGEKMDRFGRGPAERTKTFRAVLNALNLSDIVAGSVLAFQLLFMRVQSRYGGSTLPQRQKTLRAEDQMHLEPMSRRGRGYDNAAGEDEYETYYSQGYTAPPMPPAARDPSPGAAFGRPQTFRGDDLRPGMTRQDSYQRKGYARSYSPDENQPLQEPRENL